ncbi:MAG TPA: hypothetical protein VD766_11625, partial [Solirubrobacterales bacterium]|nr:hypothetical protein [Solirubrobacterales bacterium]
AVWVALLLLPASAGAARPLATGFADLLYQDGDPSVRSQVFDETQRVNAGVVRLAVSWKDIAPKNEGPDFDATNPASPGYTWQGVDPPVAEASARGLRIVFLISNAPDWAEGANRPSDAEPGSWLPRPNDVADFGTALATRYSGGFEGLPRVTDYQLWAEPNLGMYLSPQWDGEKPVAPFHYRDMLNAFYGAVHAVDNGNRVIAGGTAPYGMPPGGFNMRPLFFWRKYFCVQDDAALSPADCPVKPRLDVLAHHPINTTGGPSDSATDPDDITVPDMSNLIDVLRAAERAGNVQPGGNTPVWATEIWWESNPPDPAAGNPSLKLQGLWYEEALYNLWKQGVSLSLLLQVRDQPYDGVPGRSNYQTGVFTSDGTAKPAARALTFPFVGDRLKPGKLRVWGKAPASGKLEIQRQSGKGKGKGKGKGGFRTIKTIRVTAGSVFSKSIKYRGRVEIRGRVAGMSSLVWTSR